MNNEVLERLLIDSASGELAPDVAELLEAHLQQNPAARKEAAEVGETLRLAQLALAGQPSAALPVVRPSWRVPTWALGMAACFICGLSLGILGMRGRNEPPRITASIRSQEMSAVKTVAGSGLWSARRFRAGLSPSAVAAGNRIIWKSPVRKPEIF